MTDEATQDDMDPREAAILEGLRAHEEAAQAEAETKRVLAEWATFVSKTLGEVSVGFEIGEVNEPAREQSLQERMTSIPAPRRKVLKLLVRARTGEWVSLADVNRSPTWFPLTLRWGASSALVHSAAQLESTLVELFRSPETGHVLRTLQSRLAHRHRPDS